MAEKRRTLNFFLLICALTGGALFFGCSGGASSDPVPITTLQISGNIQSAVPLANIVYENNLQPDIRAQQSTAGVTVYLEADETKSTTTDSNGNYVLSGIPAGSHRIVARIKTLSGNTYKVRSEPITVSDSNPEAAAPQLELKAANYTISGILKKADGTPFSYAKMTLWGESFTTDNEGKFVTPPMVKNTSESVTITNAGFQTTVLSFTFTDNASFVEQTVVSNAATNRAPSTLLSSVSYTAGKKQTLKLTATATDPDNDTLSYSWSATSGSLGTSTTGDNQKTWTAPDADTVATITVTVSDNGNPSLNAVARVMIKVGQGIIIPNTPPTFTRIDANATTLTGNRVYALSAIATDSNRDTLSYSWTASSGTLLTPLNQSTVSWRTPDVVSDTNTQVAVQISDSKENGTIYGTQIFTVKPTVANNAPVASIESAATEFISNNSYTLTASATDLDGDTLTYAWTASAGTVSNSTSQSATWKTPPTAVSTTVQITLTVSDPNGGETQVTRNITVAVDPGHVAPTAAIFAPENGDLYLAGADVFCYGLATDSAGSISPTKFSWDIQEEGQTRTSIAYKRSSFSLPLNKPGNYTLILEAPDSIGIIAEASVQFRINATPTAAITQPSSTIFQKGAAVTFTGTCSDTEDGTLTANSYFRWQFPDPTGVRTARTLSVNDIPAGTQTVKLNVYDTMGAVSATASKEIYINSNPLITAITPAKGSLFRLGDKITFTTTITDPDETVATSSISWYSGATLLGRGYSIDVSTFTKGLKDVTINVSDSMGGSTSSATQVIINDKPSMAFALPTNNSAVFLDQPLTFKGSGTSAFGDSILPATMLWQGYKTGIGTYTIASKSAEFEYTYTGNNKLGKHIITLSGEDTYGATGSAQLTLYVNATPTVSITAPASGTRFDTGAAITFSATKSDPDTTDTLSLEWFDGATSIGTGDSISVSTLASGSHNIICEVTDTHGIATTTSISVLVNTLPTVSVQFDTALYASASGQIPVFLSEDPSMEIQFTAVTNDQEIGGNIESYDANLIRWYTVKADNSLEQIATGKTLTTTLPLGTSNILLRVYDSFYSGFEQQASASVAIPVRVWQSISYPYGSGVLHDDCVDISTQSKAKDADLVLTYSDSVPGTPKVQTVSFKGDFGAQYFEDETTYSLATPAFVMAMSSVEVDSTIHTLGLKGDSSQYIWPVTENGTLADSFNSGLNGARSICTDGTRIYASNYTGNTVVMLTAANGALSKTVSEANNISFNRPIRVRYSNRGYGKVFIADRDNDRIVRFSSELMATALTQLNVAAPSDMAFTNTYILGMNSTSGEMTVIDPTVGTILTFGSNGTGMGEFENPKSICSTGYDLFVVEDNRLQVIRSGMTDWLK